MKSGLYWLAKGLELAGMVVVLAGVVASIRLGMQEEGLKSMAYEGYALMIGGGLFFGGLLIERRLGMR